MKSDSNVSDSTGGNEAAAAGAATASFTAGIAAAAAGGGHRRCRRMRARARPARRDRARLRACAATSATARSVRAFRAPAPRQRSRSSGSGSRTNAAVLERVVARHLALGFRLVVLRRRMPRATRASDVGHRDRIDALAAVHEATRLVVAQRHDVRPRGGCRTAVLFRRATSRTRRARREVRFRKYPSASEGCSSIAMPRKAPCACVRARLRRTRAGPASCRPFG